MFVGQTAGLQSRRCNSCDILCHALTTQDVKQAQQVWWLVSSTIFEARVVTCDGRSVQVQSSLEHLLHHEIQHKMPYHLLSTYELEFMRSAFRDPERRRMFAGHSKWLVQLLLKVRRAFEARQSATGHSLMLTTGYGGRWSTGRS
jgi:hypothetical protein